MKLTACIALFSAMTLLPALSAGAQSDSESQPGREPRRRGIDR